MIQYRLTLDNGREIFVLANNFAEAIYQATLEIRCAEYLESREYVCPAIVSLEIWDTVKFRHVEIAHVQNLQGENTHE